MEIIIYLSPEMSEETGLSQITVDYTDFIVGLQDGNLDEIADKDILIALARHLRKDDDFFAGFKVKRDSVNLKVNR
jgi:hypothetical protein